VLPVQRPAVSAEEVGETVLLTDKMKQVGVETALTVMHKSGSFPRETSEGLKEIAEDRIENAKVAENPIEDISTEPVHYKEFENMDVGSKRVCDVVMIDECYQVPDMSCTDVQNSVEKTVYDTKCHTVQEKECHVEQESRCHDVPDQECQVEREERCHTVPDMECNCKKHLLQDRHHRARNVHWMKINHLSTMNGRPKM
jgi:hypothetical protein